MLKVLQKKDSSGPDKEKIKELISHAKSVILDKETEIQLCVACFLSKGHLLIEDRPGMGKTSLVKTFAKLFGLESQRIQFTNDMLPADIIGTSIYNDKNKSFEFHKGPIFANYVLADEINRATPKTQSACLQAMEENMISMDGTTYQLPTPFFLVATQNPSENVGTFPLPESQLDRFLMRIELGYPTRTAEREILVGKPRIEIIEKLPQVFTSQSLSELILSVESVFASEQILDYLQDIVEKTRAITKGLSPRGARDFLRAARAWAFIEGRDFIIPEDIQAVGVSVLNHRIAGDDLNNTKTSFELAKEIIRSVSVP